MSCSVTKIDHLNFNDQGAWPHDANPVYDSARGKVYFVYSNNESSVSGVENRTIWFREWDVATLAFSAAVLIERAGGSNRADSPSLVMLTDGRLVVAYTFFTNGTVLYETHAAESTDHGATWTVVTADTSAAGRMFVDIATDGTNVYLWCYAEGGGAGGKSLYSRKRTGAGTWSAAVLCFDGGGGTFKEHNFAGDGGTKSATRKYGYVKDATTAFIIMPRQNGDATHAVLSCIRTTDSGASWSEVVIEDFGVVVDLEQFPVVQVGTDARVRILYTNKVGTAYHAYLAYSDDYGLTWTLVGEPTEITLAGQDLNYLRPSCAGYILGNDNTAYITGWRYIDLGLGQRWTVYVYKGGDLTSGWTLIQTCDIGNGDILKNASHAVFIGTDLLVVLDPNIADADGGGSAAHLGYLVEADIDTPGGTAPPLVEESESGSDQPNMYLRLDIADDRGWSAHQVGVTCFVEWGEGDYTTERRKLEVLGAVSSMDANIQDPALLPAYWKMDDPERWGKEAFVSDGTNIVSIDDPFLFIWRSTDLNIGEAGSQNVMRGVYLKYRRPSVETFDVQVWIDGQIADTQTIPAQQGPDSEPAEFWWPIPRSTNVGSRIQLRIEDRERIDLKVEEFAVKFRPKHWRMRG